MINGITILNEEVCNEGYMTAHIVFAILFIVFALATIFLLMNFIRHGDYNELLFLISMAFISIVMFGVAIVTAQRLSDTYTKYEVTISDDVSMEEFTDKYSIIEQRGDIYVIKEKENG